MVLITALIAFFLLTPVLIIILTTRSSVANKIGSIIIAYAIGILVGNSGIFPKASAEYRHLMLISGEKNVEVDTQLIDQWERAGKITSADKQVYQIEKIQEMFAGLSVLIAIPLLLFSMNIRKWFRMAGKTVISMVLALLSVSVVIFIGYFIFRNKISGLHKIAGMLVGLYSGGTPNLAALKMALKVDAGTYIMTHTYDTLLSLLYLLFLMSAGKNLFRIFLSRYPGNGNNPDISYTENGYHDILKKKYTGHLFIALLLAGFIMAAGWILGALVSEKNMMTILVLSITSLGIISSLVPYVHKIKKSFELGMYFILVFSIDVATMADISDLIHISFSLMVFIGMVLFGSLLLHTLLSKIFRVDADTLMITSTALICSPPFVPVIAGALKNKEIIVSGLTVGIIGYALGNYLGVLMNKLLMLFL